MKCPAVTFKHCLVLAPLNAVLNWVLEWHKWLDKRNQLKVRHCTAFRFSAPRVWNSSPVSVRESQSIPTFRRHLKTFYFQSAYPPSAVHLALKTWRYISRLFTYLLTLHSETVIVLRSRKCEFVQLVVLTEALLFAGPQVWNSLPSSL